MITLDTYFISDTHFKESGIFKASSKRKSFNSISNIDRTMWKHMQSLSYKDTLIHLGDLNYKDHSNEIIQNMSSINCYKIFLPGNHDIKNYSFYKKGFNHVIEGINDIKTNIKDLNALIIEVNNCKILISHFPVFNISDHDKIKDFYPAILELQNIFEKENCDLNIHGHIHDFQKDTYKSFNVSVENINFKPIQLRDILKQKGFL